MLELVHGIKSSLCCIVLMDHVEPVELLWDSEVLICLWFDPCISLVKPLASTDHYSFFTNYVHIKYVMVFCVKDTDVKIEREKKLSEEFKTTTSRRLDECSSFVLKPAATYHDLFQNDSFSSEEGEKWLPAKIFWQVAKIVRSTALSVFLILECKFCLENNFSKPWRKNKGSEGNWLKPGKSGRKGCIVWAELVQTRLGCFVA